MTTKESTPLEIAKTHYHAWLGAELAVTTHQSYSIGSRSLTMANLADIRMQITYWKNEVINLQNISKRKGRNRIMRVVPRDL